MLYLDIIYTYNTLYNTSCFICSIVLKVSF